MDKKLRVSIEEALNTRLLKTKNGSGRLILRADIQIEEAVIKRLNSAKNDESFYEMTLRLISRLGSSFRKKDGSIDEPAFYRYARIDKSTWSNIRWNVKIPDKKTLLKLVIALRLSESDANTLMAKASSQLNVHDRRDLVILALIDIKCYDIETVYDVLDEYGNNGKSGFDNIYDTYEDKQEKKFLQRKNLEQK